VDSRRVIEIILDEAGRTEERFPGYREELQTLVADIVSIERKHRYLRRDVKKEIADQINNLGTELAQKSAQDGSK
jgi:hypothetical protein